MDNADLEKLSVVPGRLSPKFNPNVTEYSVTLGSDVKQIKIDPLTSDSGASYCISVCIVIQLKNSPWFSRANLNCFFVFLGWRWREIRTSERRTNDSCQD